MTDILVWMGSTVFGRLWLPALAWTFLAGIALLVLGSRRALHPLMRYRLRQALLFALPATLLATPVMPVRLIPGGLINRAASLESATQLRTPTEMPPATEGTGLPELGLAESDAARGIPAGPSVPPLPVAHGDNGVKARWIAVASALGGLVGLAASLLAAAHLWLVLMELEGLRRLTRTAKEVTDARSLRLLTRLRGELGVRRPVRLLEGSEASVPMTFGLRKHSIVIPEGMLALSDELRMTLLHELVHVARSDFGWALCERIVCAVFAAHPLIWRLRRGIDRDREYSCDAEVVGSGQATPHAYANLLYAFGDRSRARLAIAAGLATPTSHLKERIETMKTFLNAPTSSRLKLRSVGAAMVLATSSALLGACTSLRETPHAEQHPEVVLVSPGGQLTDEGLAIAVGRLSAKIAYLDRELDEIMSRGDEARTNMVNWTRTDRTRFTLLSHMYEETWQQLETLKMEQAAAEVDPVDPLRMR